MLFSSKSAMAKPTILFSISQTQPLPLFEIKSFTSSSETRAGSERAFSFTEFRTL